MNLIVTRMGAKVEGESYMPGYYAMRDLNMDTNGRWSPYYEEKMSTGQLCNGFLPKLTNGYSEFDKEMLKRTMLEHEAIFRQQVYELHRVYKIQRDLMKELQNKEIYTFPITADTSQTNSLSSQMPPNGAKMIWQMQMPPVATTYGKAPVVEPNNTNQSFKFLREGSVQSSPNGFPSIDVASKSKKGTFDLQLPADYYLDDENASDNKPIDFLGVTSDTKPQNDADLTLISGEGLRKIGDNSSTSGLWTTKNPGGQQVADLNEPITGMYIGRANDSASRGLSHTLENPSYQPVLRPSTSYFDANKDYSRDRHTDEGTSSNFFDASSKIRQEEKPVVDKGKQVSSMNFFTPRYSDAELQKSFRGAYGRFMSNSQFLYQGQNNSVEWFARSTLEPSAINNFARFNRPHSNLATPTAPFSIPYMDHPSVASPLGSCTVDPKSSVNNNPAVPSIPSFNASSAVNSYTSLSAVSQSIGTSSHKMKSTDNINGFYSGFPLDSVSASRSRHQVPISKDLEQSNSPLFEHSARQSHGDLQCANGKGIKNFNLNETLSDAQEDGLLAQDGRCIGSLEHSKGEGLVLGISCLQNNTTCAEPTGLEKLGKAFGYSNGDIVELENNKDRKETALTLHNLSDSALASQGCGIYKNDASEDGVARILLVGNKTQESATCLPLSCHKHVTTDKPSAGGVDKSGALVRNLIDLNDDIPNEDNSESSVVSHECHAASLHSDRAKPTFVIDLEAPACEEDGAWTYHQECTPPGELDASQEVDDTFAMSTVAAAKNIVAMSMDVPATTEAADDTLQWFAALATSNIDGHAEQAEVQDYINNSGDDGLDSFESLTLKLEETKIDQYCSKPLSPAATTDEQTASAVLLLTRPKRGQQRRRRQKRDFQKDILPGLATLSRHEVTEDLQLLDGLVRASGGSWQMGLGRRGRYAGRTRGRKPRKNVTVTIEEEIEFSPPAKPDTANLEADDKGMFGWGRTTRRCRRSRCPLGNNIAAAS